MVRGVVLCDFIAEAQVVVSLKNDCDALPWGKEETDIEPGIGAVAAQRRLACNHPNL